MKYKKRDKKTVTKVKKIGKLSEFSIQFMPFSEINSLESEDRIKKILDIISEETILILQGKLKPEEENKLISDTMTMVRNVNGFCGIELAVITNELKDENFWKKIGRKIAKLLSGADLHCITILGPATIVKQIKRDPKKIELLLNSR